MKPGYRFRKRLTFFHILFFFCILSSKGQKTIDSLNKVLTGNIPDTLRFRTIMAIAGEHYLDAPELAIKDCEAALALSEKIKFEEGIGESLGWLAYLHEQQGNITVAIDYYNRSLVLAKKTGSKKSEATIYSNLGIIYNNLGMPGSALNYYRDALKIREEIKDSSGIATAFNNIGLVYQFQGKIPEALENLSMALHYYELLDDKDGMATAHSNIASVYQEQKQFENAKVFYFKSLAVQRELNDKYGSGATLNLLGGLYEEMGVPDSALYYFTQALQVRMQINDKQGIAYTQKNLGNVYIHLGKPEEAKAAFVKSLTAFEELSDKKGISVVTNLYGASLLNEGDFINGENYLERSLRVARELNFPADIRNAAGNLQQLYRKKNRWKDALMMYDLFIQMRDTIGNNENIKAALKTQAKYEYEKKEAILKSEQEKKNAIADAELKKQKLIRNSAAGGMAVVAFFLLVVFIQRNKISTEKKRSDDLLLNILPEETAEELKLTGSAKAKSFDMVTVLFSDFKNFTQATEKLSAEDLVAEINYCYSEFDKIISRHGIEKIKTIGDAYMCAGGLPASNTTHPFDVVQAGLEMQEFILSNKEQREREGKPFFELRIGIHSGPVVAGIVGIKKFAYDIWGDTVNIASRMESSGETGKVNISRATYELVKERFNCEYRGKVEAKNKGQIEMYFVEGRNTKAD
jgi:adenylate cyclase